MHKIAIIPGDGTGPEVVVEGMKVLAAAAQKFNFKYESTEFDFGGDRYLRTNEVLPASAVEDMRQFDGIFLGAIGHPDVKPGILEKGILLHLRFELDQYINLRPVKLYPGVETPIKDKGPDEIDFVVVRENTEGLYAGAGGHLKKGTADEIAVQESINTRKGVERCLRYAFDYTRRRNKTNTLTLCGKTNVLTFAFDLVCSVMLPRRRPSSLSADERLLTGADSRSDDLLRIGCLTSLPCLACLRVKEPRITLWIRIAAAIFCS